jgi:hypothetical protein
MLLLNVTSPQDVVAEMARLARPGGIVALQEPDSAAWVIDPPHPAWDLLLTEVIDVYPRIGRDFHTGRRAARLLREAGPQDVQVGVGPQARGNAGPGGRVPAFRPPRRHGDLPHPGRESAFS